jgi:dTDP-4-amino-4,6-dideoxygalactose transaminase
MDSSNHLYLIRIPGMKEEQRNRIIEKMGERGVATNVHYKPMPMMTAYREMSGGIGRYPNSYEYYQNLITLPLHTMLSDEDVEYVIHTLKTADFIIFSSSSSGHLRMFAPKVFVQTTLLPASK